MGSFVNFAELKQRVSIEQVAKTLPVKWEVSNNQLRATCPVHGGERGLIVTSAKQLFICMADGRKGGDAIQLVAHVTGCTVNEAAHQIEKQFGTTVTVTVQLLAITVPQLPRKRRGDPTPRLRSGTVRFPARPCPRLPRPAQRLPRDPQGLQERICRHRQQQRAPGAVRL
jgi:CHC2 zinc finger